MEKSQWPRCKHLIMSQAPAYQAQWFVVYLWQPPLQRGKTLRWRRGGGGKDTLTLSTAFIGGTTPAATVHSCRENDTISQ